MSSDATLAAESRVPGILIGLIVPTVTVAVFVVGRLYTRAIITKNWGADDTLIAIAWAISIAGTIMGSLLTKYDFGHHTMFIRPESIEPGAKLAFAGALLFQIVVCLSKLGMCSSYMRVFQDRRSKIFLYSIMAFLIASTIAIMFMIIFKCNPVAAAWIQQLGKCTSPNPNIYTSAVCNIIADVMLMAFVIPRVLNLQMARRQKIALLVVASLGILVIVASIVRCDFYASLTSDPDPSWNGVNGSTWGSVEMQVGLFCACAPCLRPLLRQIAPGLMSSISQSISGPSNVRTGTKSGVFSSGPYFSTRSRRDIEAYELQSETDLRFPGKGTTSNAFWGGKGKAQGSGDVDDNDDGSEKAVFYKSSNIGDIVKTVRVTVKDSSSVGDEGDIIKENSVKKFEHV